MTAQFKEGTDFVHKMAQSKIRALELKKNLIKLKAKEDIKRVLKALKANLINEGRANDPAAKKMLSDMETKTLEALENM